jgi:hypothetical protein
MQDEHKTKGQLTSELHELRQQLAELEEDKRATMFATPGVCAAASAPSSWNWECSGAQGLDVSNSGLTRQGSILWKLNRTNC